MSEGHLIKSAVELARAMHHVADENLPERLAGIVKTHAGIAVASAAIPIPGADVAAAGANIWTMYVRMNKELELPFSENMIKSLAAGVATNIGGAAAGLLVLGTAVKLFPGIGTVGGAVLMGSTVYGMTIVSGIVYMKAITALVRKKGISGISEDDLRNAAASELANRSNLKDMLKTTKKEYQH